MVALKRPSNSRRDGDFLHFLHDLKSHSIGYLLLSSYRKPLWRLITPGISSNVPGIDIGYASCHSYRGWASDNELLALRLPRSYRLFVTANPLTGVSTLPGLILSFHIERSSHLLHRSSLMTAEVSAVFSAFVILGTIYCRY